MNITKSEFFAKVKKFCMSKYYPLVIFAIAMLAHVTGLDVAGYAVIVVIATFVNITVDDGRPFIAALLLGGMATSRINAFGKGDASSLYSNPVVLVILVVLGVIAVGGAVAHVIIYKRYKGVWEKLKKSPLILSIAVLCVAMLLGGLFSKYLDFMSYIVSGAFVAVLVGVFIFAKLSLNEKEGMIDYVLFCVMMLAIGVALAVLEFYIATYRGQPLDSAFKDTMLLGTYVSNSAGEMLVISLPVFFYFGSTKKHGWAYILGATAIMLVVLLTLSRASLLFGAPLYVFGVLWCCFKGENKKFSRIFTLSGIALVVVGVVVFLCMGGLDIIGGFFADTGFADRGRFSLWEQMLQMFAQNPVFGAGFSVLYQINNHAQNSTNLYTALAHNTVFQMIGSCGTVGVLAYAFHRFQTVRVYVKRFNVPRFFVGITVLAFVLLALLDQIFFFPQFVILYAILLAVTDVDYVSNESEQKKEENNENQADEKICE